MNLVIDIGNTRTKAALFNKCELVELKWFQTPAEILQSNLFLKQAKQAIIASVINEAEDFCNQLNTILPSQLFSANSFSPLKNLYQSVSTLGSDRLAASIGAFTLYPASCVLVIDAGTCIKYNFTNDLNEYLGGGISPGIRIKFKALHNFTGKLPLVEPDYNFKDLIGNTTQHSILSGVLNGTIAEIDGVIDLYKAKFPNLIVVITGGDSTYLAERLKNSIFVIQNLVLSGLNYILNSTLQ